MQTYRFIISKTTPRIGYPYKTYCFSRAGLRQNCVLLIKTIVLHTFVMLQAVPEQHRPVATAVAEGTRKAGGRHAEAFSN